MKILPLVLALLPVMSWAQALPNPAPAVADARLRLALGETVKAKILSSYPTATPTQVNNTLQKIGLRFADAANNPIYQTASSRWAVTGLRILQRANPYIFIALELCYWQGFCDPNPKLDISAVQSNDTFITAYSWDFAVPTMPLGFVYFAGRSVPVVDFSCGGTDSFIRYGAYPDAPSYFPGAGSPCRVQAGISSATTAHTGYLQDYQAYFDFAPSSFTYTVNLTLPQILSPAIVCTSMGSGPNPNPTLHPYWPCKSQTPIPGSSFIYDTGPGNPYTFTYTGKTSNNLPFSFVTDFDPFDLSVYPLAPEKGRISSQVWLDSLTPLELASPLSPEFVSKIAEAAWREAEILPSFDGLPVPEEGLTPEDADIARDLYPTEWPTIDDLIYPVPDNNWLPYSKPNTNPTTKVYRFNWNCGWGFMPKCNVQFNNPNQSPDLDFTDSFINIFDNINIEEITGSKIFSNYINSRLSGVQCSPYPVSGTVLGKNRSFSWDFCPFANVARDVLAFIAYMFTVGFFISGLRTSKVRK